MSKSEEYSHEANRSLDDYLGEMNGLAEFLKYAHRFGGNNPAVIDIGAGMGNAIKVLRRNDMGNGIDFHALGLVYPSILVDFPYYVTEMERMNGVPNNFFAAVIANNSLPYADASEAVPAIDRILIPGGAIKATFPWCSIDFDGPTLYDCQQWLIEWRKMGYKICVSSIGSPVDPANYLYREWMEAKHYGIHQPRDGYYVEYELRKAEGEPHHVIVIAIKSGGSVPANPQILMESDDFLGINYPNLFDIVTYPNFS